MVRKGCRGDELIRVGVVGDNGGGSGKMGPRSSSGRQLVPSGTVARDQVSSRRSGASEQGKALPM
jgi:hypothetical protein